MHGFESAEPALDDGTTSGPWWKELNRYHWFVLTVAALGWLFDTMDQQLFTLARMPAMKELLAFKGQSPEDLKKAMDFYGPLVTSIFMIGWATGGLIFGVLGDRVGRAKVLLAPALAVVDFPRVKHGILVQSAGGVCSPFLASAIRGRAKRSQAKTLSHQRWYSALDAQPRGLQSGGREFSELDVSRIGAGIAMT